MRTFMTVVFVIAMASGCVGDPDVPTRPQSRIDGNAIATNGIATNGIALNGIATNGIATNQLSNNLYLLADNNLMETAESREVLKYVISCAIPSGITLQAEHGGVTYVFPGDIGLAPDWLRRGLRETEQRWVSSCLLSRVNRFGVSVTISIRGPSKSLAVTADEATDYFVEEGAFYGNVFNRTTEAAPIDWNACRGRDQAAGDDGTLDLRDCAEPDPAHPGLTLCGFNYAGDCADWALPANTYACKKFRQPVEHLSTSDTDLAAHAYLGGYYEDCFDRASSGNWSGARRFSEVITVFLMP